MNYGLLSLAGAELTKAVKIHHIAIHSYIGRYM